MAMVAQRFGALDLHFHELRLFHLSQSLFYANSCDETNPAAPAK
jgi:hypothetical protein